jgi:hypothetical protein
MARAANSLGKAMGLMTFSRLLAACFPKHVPQAASRLASCCEFSIYDILTITNKVPSCEAAAGLFIKKTIEMPPMPFRLDMPSRIDATFPNLALQHIAPMLSQVGCDIGFMLVNKRLGTVDATVWAPDNRPNTAVLPPDNLTTVRLIPIMKAHNIDQLLMLNQIAHQRASCQWYIETAYDIPSNQDVYAEIQAACLGRPSREDEAGNDIPASQTQKTNYAQGPDVQEDEQPNPEDAAADDSEEEDIYAEAQKINLLPMPYSIERYQGDDAILEALKSYAQAPNQISKTKLKQNIAGWAMPDQFTQDTEAMSWMMDAIRATSQSRIASIPQPTIANALQKISEQQALNNSRILMRQALPENIDLTDEPDPSKKELTLGDTISQIPVPSIEEAKDSAALVQQAPTGAARETGVEIKASGSRHSKTELAEQPPKTTSSQTKHVLHVDDLPVLKITG